MLVVEPRPIFGVAGGSGCADLAGERWKVDIDAELIVALVDDAYGEASLGVDLVRELDGFLLIDTAQDRRWTAAKPVVASRKASPVPAPRDVGGGVTAPERVRRPGRMIRPADRIGDRYARVVGAQGTPPSGAAWGFGPTISQVASAKSAPTVRG